MDGAASIVIDLILGTTAGFLTHESKRLLVGEGADPKTLAAIRKLGGSGGGREQGVERVVTKAIPFARWKTAPGDAGTDIQGLNGRWCRASP